VSFSKSWLPTFGGLAILGFIVWRLGTGPFLDGLRLIDAGSLVAAIGIGTLTISLGAWRWTMFAAGLGVPLPLNTAIVRCYRAIFLNATLPSGVLGDVHRAVGHGREAGSIGRGIRAVVWERMAGQVVQVALALAILSIFPSPVRSYMPAVAGAAIVIGLVVVLFTKGFWRDASTEIRSGLLTRQGWASVIGASAVIAVGHLATFLVAARVAGVTASAFQVLPLILLALMAMLVPANVGGFGPREGVAAWAFAAAGLPAAQGVSSATAYGVLVLAASLPGAGVLLYQWIRVPVRRTQVEEIHG
jgi:uncharacterized membrane protein YbhN (UPF0104 family)